MNWLRRLRNPQRIFGRQSDRYMTRFFLPFGYRLHIFYRGDEDRDPHDHPYDFDTFPLTGYWEELWWEMPSGAWTYRMQYVRAFSLHRRKAEHTHRVIGRTEPGFFFGTKLITIVKGYPIRRKWGFWVEDGWTENGATRKWIPWREYLGAPPEQEMSTGHKVGD